MLLKLVPQIKDQASVKGPQTLSPVHLQGVVSCSPHRLPISFLGSQEQELTSSGVFSSASCLTRWGESAKSEPACTHSSVRIPIICRGLDKYPQIPRVSGSPLPITQKSGIVSFRWPKSLFNQFHQKKERKNFPGEKTVLVATAEVFLLRGVARERNVINGREMGWVRRGLHRGSVW